MDVDTVTVKTEKDNKAIVKKSKYPERYDEIHDCYTSKDYQGCLNQIALVSEEHVEYQILRSACLIHLGHKISEAHAILDEILVRHPNNAYTVYAKGLAYYHESEWEKSCEHFEKARKLDQTSDMIRAEVMMEKARAKANAAAAVAPKATSSNVIEPEAAIVAKKSKPVFRLSLPHSTSFSPSGSNRNIRRFGCELCNVSVTLCDCLCQRCLFIFLFSTFSGRNTIWIVTTARSTVAIHPTTSQPVPIS